MALYGSQPLISDLLLRGGIWRPAFTLYSPAAAEFPDEVGGFRNYDGVEATAPGHAAPGLGWQGSIQATPEDEAERGLGQGIPLPTQEVLG